MTTIYTLKVTENRNIVAVGKNQLDFYTEKFGYDVLNEKLVPNSADLLNYISKMPPISGKAVDVFFAVGGYWSSTNQPYNTKNLVPKNFIPVTAVTVDSILNYIYENGGQYKKYKTASGAIKHIKKVLL